MTNKICNHKENSKCGTAVVLGSLLVLIGVLLLAFNFGWLNPSLKSIIISWPMLLIVLAIIGYFKRQILFPTILLFTGVFFLLPRLESLYPGMLGEYGRNFASNFWPFLLIIIGLLLIIQFTARKRRKASFENVIVEPYKGEREGWIVKDVVFGGSESIFLEPSLKGGNIDAVFGGVVIDLRKTTLADTTVYLNIDAVFGGVTLYVPEDWCVKSNLDSIFGGFSDKRPNAAVANGECSSKLVLQGSVIFSGCTIQ